MRPIDWRDNRDSAAADVHRRTAQFGAQGTFDTAVAHPARTIALVSMPGGGKSTVGRQLARRLGWSFVDSDAEIERRIGCSIRAFFEREGEDRFRDIEQQVIAEFGDAPNAVLATGGGAVLREANRTWLHRHATVVYLRSTPEDLFRRLRFDAKRPLLQVADPLARLRDLFATRDPLYLQTAHFVIDTGRPSVPTLVNMILMQLELAGVVDPSNAPTQVDSPRPPSESPPGDPTVHLRDGP
jgi:shikimate kinase